MIYLYDLYIQTISQFKGLYLVLRGLAKIASKIAQHQFTLYITFILYKNMNSSNIKIKKIHYNMCHIICIKPYHHTVSKFHHFFLSKMFMRIHFFCCYITEQTGRVQFLPGPRIVSTFSRENEYGFTYHVQYIRDTYD